MFQPDAGSVLTSFHSHRKADTVCERYYASLGQNRLKLPEEGHEKDHQRILADAAAIGEDQDARQAPPIRVDEEECLKAPEDGQVPEDGLDSIALDGSFK